MAKFKYHKNAKWQDVLKGKPVAKGDRRRGKLNRAGMKRREQTYRCRDCRKCEQIILRPGVNDRTHRCGKCGGILDPVIDGQPPAA